ncbi:monocarboxylate transporter 9-like isoform X1 [Penaeus monodon]|uniref:monocarboxylate transporter 9-like isoform X1 n=2 Tax=Penaeus monodon TaxID=6687 RepID=UPI0018A78977|nr:monocarboxylate transporter 9-like isoform X1 [Penaeus monodon]XP_037801020.1 monocarboxylate transporter 9-like isoform X1 [Penaeus monodon]XP_037801021.1 monocarboxylate transporter 9-like isoform X1 [Penaeus monodon]
MPETRGRSDAREKSDAEDGASTSLTNAEAVRGAEVKWRRVPPDGGWGWMVTLGGAISAMLIPMLSPCFGILFSPPLLASGANTSTIAIIFNTFMVMWKVTGTLVGSLVKEFGYRKVAMTGNLIVACSMVACAFSTSPRYILIFFSLCCGFGAGLSSARFLILAQYFDKRRGLANACLTAGVGVGYFLNPLFIRFLQDEYSYKGATLIIGAFILHGFAAASLYHPVEWHLKAVQDKGTEKGEEPLMSASASEENSDLEEVHLKNVENEELPRLQTPTELRLKYRERHDSLNSQTSDDSVRYKSQALTLSALDLCSVASLPIPQAEEPEQDKNSLPDSESRICAVYHTISRVLRSVVKDISILRSPVAVIIGLSATFCASGHTNFTMVVPFALQAVGHSPETAAWSISTAGIVNLVVRTSVSVMSDKKWFNMRLWYMVSIANLALSIFLFTFMTDFVGITVVMSLMGFGVGGFQGMHNLLMARTIGLERLTSMFSTTSLLVGIGSMSIGPFVGWIRDITGSYEISMRVLSCIIFSSFLLWLLMPAAQACEKRRKEWQPDGPKSPL